MAIDLHIHSNYSDGTVPAADLPLMAAEKALKAIALTDHDTTAGIAEFTAQQSRCPDTELIAGVELSTLHGARELHIVGLFIDPQNAELQSFMKIMQQGRIQRASEMIEKLKSLNYTVTWDDLYEAGATVDGPGRPHFARVLVKKYNFPDTAAVFERLLKRGAAGYVPRRLPEPADAIKVIKAAGGTAVWAHPFHARRNENNAIRRIIAELKISGLDAIEAYYSEYTPTCTANALKIAAEFKLAVSGGSDFHGEVHKDILLGSGRGNLAVPDDILANLRKAREPKAVLV